MNIIQKAYYDCVQRQQAMVTKKNRKHSIHYIRSSELVQILMLLLVLVICFEQSDKGDIIIILEVINC